MIIESLTEAQKRAIPEYIKLGVQIGLATGSDLNEEEVRDLTDKHRATCGLKPAEKFLVFDSPFQAISKVKGLTVSNALYGQHDIHWLIFYAFFRIELGLVKETESIVYLLELAKHCGWMWMDETTTVVTRRPDKIHIITSKQQRQVGGEITELKVLHNPNGKALEYRDGTGIYMLYGTRLSKEYEWLVTNAGNYSIKDVLEIKNTAIKTLGLRVLGPKALIEIGKKIDFWKSKVGGNYTLYEVEINSNSRRYLSGNCPSKHEPFCEAVPPTIQNCKQALAWREEEISLDNYCEPKVRT